MMGCAIVSKVMQNVLAAYAESLAELSADDWRDRVETIAETHGHFQPLGKRHFAALIEEGSTLLVTFETEQAIRGVSEEARPLGWQFVAKDGWSHLLIAADGETWFRDPAVWAYFDRHIDDGFFDEFENVIFYGAGPCGYAAAAYSVASPGSTVVAIQPQATLDPRVAEWDDRFLDMRKSDFTSRFGFAPDMIDAAARAFILYDPDQTLDAMHAALFTRPMVQKLRMRFMGDAIQGDLIAMNELGQLLRLAAAGELDTLSFARLFRARRGYPPYLRRLMAALDGDGRDRLTRMLAHNVVNRMHAPRFQRRLNELEATLGND